MGISINLTVSDLSDAFVFDADNTLELLALLAETEGEKDWLSDDVAEAFSGSIMHEQVAPFLRKLADKLDEKAEEG